MSLLTKDGRLSVKPFAAVPALLDLPEIHRQPASVSNASSRSSARGGVDLEEGCLITKSVKYTHQVAYLVNEVRFGDPVPIEDLINFLNIVPYAEFTLNDPCNLVLLEGFVHTSLDLYAFIALVPSYPTVNELINMVKSDNDRRQQEMKEMGHARHRSLDFHLPSFSDPEYELISLHPEHFLPRGAILPICDPATGTWKNYVASRDRRLRESVEPDSARLPPFRHDPQNRFEVFRLNIFLVAINAEIKFRRYFQMIQQDPPTTPLPGDVLQLMDRVMKLVRLLYWVPAPAKGSTGEAIRAKLRRNNPERAAKHSQPRYTKMTSGEESPQTPPKASTSARLAYWLALESVEERMAYATALMCGHDVDYDPALFENAFPIDNAPRLYSDNVTIEAWKQGVAPEEQLCRPNMH